MMSDLGATLCATPSVYNIPSYDATNQGPVALSPTEVMTAEESRLTGVHWEKYH